jgi:hypothetical protein
VEFLQIAGYAAPVIIVGLVQLAKNAGFPSKFAGLLAVGLGMALGGLAYAGSLYPAVQDALVYVVGGLVAGLSASGLWSTIKAALF